MSLILSGKSFRPLAKKISTITNTPLATIEMDCFPNVECKIRVVSEMKNKDVIIIQSTSNPVNTHVMEIALMADAAKRAGAKSIKAIIPWFGYSPQDKVFREGEPLSSQVVVTMLENVGIDEFVVVDIHSPLVLEMFTKPVTNLSVSELFANYCKNRFNLNQKDYVVASLDKGGAKRAEDFSRLLGVDLVKFSKSRDRTTGQVTFHGLTGDVKNKNVISFDDYLSTGGTLIQSADYLKSHGAKEYTCCVTHAVVEETLAKVEKSKIDKLITTNTIPLPTVEKFEKVEVVDISGVIEAEL